MARYAYLTFLLFFSNFDFHRRLFVHMLLLSGSVSNYVRDSQLINTACSCSLLFVRWFIVCSDSGGTFRLRFVLRGCYGFAHFGTCSLVGRGTEGASISFCSWLLQLHSVLLSGAHLGVRRSMWSRNRSWRFAGGFPLAYFVFLAWIVSCVHWCRISMLGR